jgi:xylan 1,4-beta-xylosidase
MCAGLRLLVQIGENRRCSCSPAASLWRADASEEAVRSAKIKLSLSSHALPPRPRGWSNPIVPGDHPDPTIIQVGGTFWASATSGEWSPQFPLFRSNDLVRWTSEGAIFPIQPEWAEGSFWAPELVHDEVTDRCLVWYVGKRRGGPLCIAVATAPSPGGPYTDHGPLVCEEDGSIDPCFARDEHGAPYLLWKEDGNSQGRPTPIWAQPLSDDLLRLTGEKTQLIVNDQPWEEGVVEGPYILRHAGWFYMFYAGNSCCGRECKYAEGIARSPQLLGPWEKFSSNPLIGANDRWRCPGHGTAVRGQARPGEPVQDYLLYHAYPAVGTIYVGREAILDEIVWPGEQEDGTPGWPSINAGRGPGGAEPGVEDPAPPVDFIDHFTSPSLGPSWQWPVNTYPQIAAGEGWLTLGIPLASPLSPRPVESAIVAVPRPAGRQYQTDVALAVPSTPEPALWAGLAVIGDPFNTIGIGLRGRPGGEGSQLVLWQRGGDSQSIVWQTHLEPASVVYLRCTSVGEEHHLQFAYSLEGEHWHDAGGPYDASDLPAWDRALRIGLMLEGPRALSATFSSFVLRAQ